MKHSMRIICNACLLKHFCPLHIALTLHVCVNFYLILHVFTPKFLSHNYACINILGSMKWLMECLVFHSIKSINMSWQVSCILYQWFIFGMIVMSHHLFRQNPRLWLPQCEKIFDVLFLQTALFHCIFTSKLACMSEFLIICNVPRGWSQGWMILLWALDCARGHSPFHSPGNWMNNVVI